MEAAAAGGDRGCGYTPAVEQGAAAESGGRGVYPGVATVFGERASVDLGWLIIRAL
ncbi:hypothetical protein D3C79_963070 [compost metagenome]